MINEFYIHTKENTCLCIAFESTIETDKVMVSEVYGSHLRFWQNCYFYPKNELYTQNTLVFAALHLKI